MDARDTALAADETFEYICDMAGSDLVLHELYDYLSLDDLVSFLHDFIRLFDMDTSGMDADTLELVNEWYRDECE